MKRGLIVLSVLASLVSCMDKSSQKDFEISGSISNTSAAMIYLDEIPVASMQRMVVDSAALGKDGNYILRAGSKEACIYNLRVSQNGYPLAALINDVSKITVDAIFKKENNQFVASYDVKGSEASQQLKDFVVGFTNNLQAVYYTNRRTDSLQKTGAPDSLLAATENENVNALAQIRNWTLEFINKSNNPALTMFVLGYYQSTANTSGFKMEALSNEQVNKIIGDLSSKFPAHQGVAAIKRSLEAQMEKTEGLIGKQAPEIILPDVNGKEIKLSSFRGKYVLVDFWASWCIPCRRENPNVVNTYNKFKNKNFEILGVSLDRPGRKDQWLKAIKEDNLTWTQVSDLKEWASAVVSGYNFGEIGIPFNVLIDPDGKIIAERLRGEELGKTLAGVLK